MHILYSYRQQIYVRVENYINVQMEFRCIISNGRAWPRDDHSRTRYILEVQSNTFTTLLNMICVLILNIPNNVILLYSPF